MLDTFLLGVDIGTTHCKAGVFGVDGTVAKHASRAMTTRRAGDGRVYYDPEEFWTTVASTIVDAVSLNDPYQIAAVGLTSMAETGLLLDRASGAPRSELLPWFDLSPQEHAANLADESMSLERFRSTGMRPTFKCGLAKLLWLREHHHDALDRVVWLSAADFVAYRLTGKMATDYSLAARTCAFQIEDRSWDEVWIHHWGFDPVLFPPALPAGQPVGVVQSTMAHVTGLRPGTPVAITGHDHLCAAVAVGAHEPGFVFDSMGTAESLLGTLPHPGLGEAEWCSGLSYGRHVVGEHYFWLGGTAASGGSVEWLRAQLGDPALSYAQLQALLVVVQPAPTGILFLPYLSGSGTPWPDATVQAAFIGLRASHGRADLLKAVLEGTAFELEAIRRAGEQVTQTSIDHIVAVGGGTRIMPWMQIKADVSGCRYDIARLDEAAVQGAAMVAGAGCGVYGSLDEARGALGHYGTTTLQPHGEYHRIYQRLYEQGYLALQQPLRQYYKQVADIP